MRFAVLKEERVEAAPGALGLCPSCGAKLVAKCGTKKVWHWAHRGRRHCDHWWEPETEWHRLWKDRFPKDWQERSARDGNGELHIADIKTPHGLVVEFQYSCIKPEEALKRTEFHAPMIWVVSGLRRTTDKIQFERAICGSSRTSAGQLVIQRAAVLESRLLQEWADMKVMVAFDFGGDSVWLMSGRDWACALGFEYKKDDLVAHLRDGTPIPHVFTEHYHPRTRNVIKRTHSIPYTLRKPEPAPELPQSPAPSPSPSPMPRSQVSRRPPSGWRRINPKI